MPSSLNSASMPKVRASSGMIGTTRPPNSPSRQQVAQQAGEGGGGRHLLLARAAVELGERRRRRHRQRPLRAHDPAGERPVEGLAARGR